MKNACDILRARLVPFATEMLKEKLERAPAAKSVVFAANFVFDRDKPETQLAFAEVLQRAYFARTSLSATGFYKTPDIVYDREAGRGKPFHYFAVGAAVSEVEVDASLEWLTSARRYWHDAGDAIDLGITRGQIEGGFVQARAG